jgi:small subunit ribosomal protein S7
VFVVDSSHFSIAFSFQSLERVKRLQLAKVREGEESLEVNPMTVFHSAMANTRPIIGTTKVTRGGKHYHVPVGVHPNRQQFLAIKWLIVAARERSGRGMAEKLALELLDAHNNEGTVIKKKQDLHRLAEANRAFAHFRW